MNHNPAPYHIRKFKLVYWCIALGCLELLLEYVQQSQHTMYALNNNENEKNVCPDALIQISNSNATPL